MDARVEHPDGLSDMETWYVNGHKLQFGGGDGDGYCYTHQSFACLDDLSDEEWEAIHAEEERMGLE
jgi:hypothetical protein